MRAVGARWSRRPRSTRHPRRPAHTDGASRARETGQARGSADPAASRHTHAAMCAFRPYEPLYPPRALHTARPEGARRAHLPSAYSRLGSRGRGSGYEFEIVL